MAGRAFAFILLPSFFLSPNLAEAQGGISASSQIVGAVRDEASRQGVVGARVDLMSPSGFAAPSQYTDTNGQFHFDRVKDGDYQVTVRKLGYETAQLSISVSGGHASNVDVDLRAERSNSDAGSKAGTGPPETVSTHELKVPQRARDESARGKELMAKSDYAGAIAEFQKATDDFPSYYEAYVRMGVAQYMAGQAPDALRSFQKSIDLSGGKYSEAFFDLAEVLNDTGDFSGAQVVARQQIELDQSWQGYFQLSRALLGLKQYPDAERAAKKCRDLNARYRQVYEVLKDIHFATHDYSGALDDIDAYLKLDPNSPASQQMRATREQLVKALANTPAKASPKTQ
ncbi:MAG TPA: carboxypeptidase regulatory-like domain-containing protein [Candidatus Acidoferrales bacterium]|nr:carboxypeptidase regulatory-like domain-containing protein [Candidatus Acidoferrales bacterium]